jgi:HK97 family phage portal protein
MGFLDRLLGREQFAQWNANDPAFADWWFRGSDTTTESVTPYTVLGLSAVLRSVQIISGTIAGLPFRSYERQGDEKVRIPSDFDDPYPTIDGLTPFAWKETVLIHLLLWRKAFLWHESRLDGSAGFAYRPLLPDTITKVYRDSQGRRRFEYKDGNDELQTVGSEQITFIPGPSLDGTDGHPLLYAARAVFSAALSGDREAQATLRRGIRIGGLVTPADNEEDFDQEEGAAILESLRSKVMGRENAGDIALINRRLKLTPWTPTNTDNQWVETKQLVLGDVERLFGVPPHLLADIEKQTSWGSGVAEQNLSLARYTLRGWSDRTQEVLSIRLPRGPVDQFCEFDYAGLLQGTPEQEIRLLIEQVEAGILTVDEARKIRNLPPLTPSQKAQSALRGRPVTDEVAA